MTEAFAYSAPTQEKKKKSRSKIIIGWLGGMLAAGSLAFAIFSQFATGDVEISTTEPNAGATLTLVGSVNFQQTGTQKPIQLQAVPTVDLQGTYASYETVATDVTTGPCAGFIHVIAASGGLGTGNWQATASGPDADLSPGGPARFTKTGGASPMVQLDAAAPQSCANQASIPLPVKLLLVP
jgi:hypothetical protein